MLSPWRSHEPLRENVMCEGVFAHQLPPQPQLVTQRSLEQLNTWPVLNSQRRMSCEPRHSLSHLKCQILGSTDRSVRTLSWLWLTLPCGRDWRGLSQDIGIHEGFCARQRRTENRLETQDRFYTTSGTLVFKAVCETRQEWAKWQHQVLKRETKFKLACIDQQGATIV